MIRIKVCGITNIDDALAASDAGADALGFIFVPQSPRYITPVAAGEIIRQLPPFVTSVGVFVNAKESAVRDAVGASGIRVIQFHGDETPSFCEGIGMPYIKAVRVKDMHSLGALEDYPGASAILLDAYSEKQYGGTGLTFNWDVAVEAVKKRRVVLAGGLGPDNVSEAVSYVNPYAVDVSSGVESSKGKKDHGAIRWFIEAARNAVV